MSPISVEFALLLFIILAGSFLILRTFCLTAGEKQQRMWRILAVGIVTWIFLLSVGSWFTLVFYLFYDIVANREFAALRPLTFIAVATGVAFRVNKVLDAATVLHYLWRTVFFRQMKRPSIDVSEEFDKKVIRDIHHLTFVKPLPSAGTKMRLLTDQEIQQCKRELFATREKKARSVHIREEIQNLKAGALTNLSEPWTIYTFGHELHDFYPAMSDLCLNPTTRTLYFKLNIRDATANTLQDSTYLFRLKQDLYHFLQVLNTDPWLAWYLEFFDRFVFVCYGIEPDNFGYTQWYPCLKIDLLRSELFQREGQFFNAADLHTICALSFNNGRPLSSELV